jgi:endonuclease/exonuclease/phosphatase (EEP) superfamily protein YafD
MNTSPYPIILCGDFNDTPTSFTYKQLSEGLNDSFANAGLGIGQTYNGKFPALRIDYILYSPELEIVNFKTSEVSLSDHYPIISAFN